MDIKIDKIGNKVTVKLKVKNKTYETYGESIIVERAISIALLGMVTEILEKKDPPYSFNKEDEKLTHEL